MKIHFPNPVSNIFQVYNYSMMLIICLDLEYQVKNRLENFSKVLILLSILIDIAIFVLSCFAWNMAINASSEFICS